MTEKQYLIDEISIQESWRIFRIISEFVDGFENLADIYPAVTVFGSSRVTESDHIYQMGHELGRLLAQAGFSVVTGGGPGAMEAANRGAFDAHGKSVGLCIELPRETGTQSIYEFETFVPVFFYQKGHVRKGRRSLCHTSGRLWHIG